MNNAAVCTEKCSTKGNPLSALKAVGGRIADSLKTAARSVVSSNAGMMAGLSMLTAASPALATDVTLRDQIKGTPDSTLNSKGNNALQISSPAPVGVTAAPSPSASAITVDLPPNSICKLKNISFVFGCRSLIATPSMDLYDYRQIFNGTCNFRLSVSSGPVENLAGRYTGDIYNEEITREKFSNPIPWTSSTNNPFSHARVLPLYLGEISLENSPAIETGPEGKRVFIKVYTDILTDKGTRFFLSYANGDVSSQDAACGPINAGYVTTTSTASQSTSFAAKVIADIEPKVVAVPPPPACGMEWFNGALAICWPESAGRNYQVQMSEGISGPSCNWKALTNIEVETSNGKNHVKIPTNYTTGFFRLAN